MWITLIKAALPSIFSTIKAFLGPALAYLKGRSDAKAKLKAQSDEQFIDKIDIANRARTQSEQLHDYSNSPNNRDKA